MLRRTRGIIVGRGLSCCLLLAVLISGSSLASQSEQRIAVIRMDGADYLPLDEMIACLAAEHSFDMISQKGKLYLRDHYAVYSVGLSVMLVDGRLYKSSSMVRRKTGRVLVPLEAGEYILMVFKPGTQMRKDQSALHLSFGDAEEWRDSAGDKQYKIAGADRISFIVIDPGHGGKDPGAVGRGGAEEKVITLKVAILLERIIKKKLPNIRVVMTRRDNRFIELAERTEIANRMLKKNENGIFLSIHVNSSLSSRVSGYETYFLSQNPTNEEARNTAALENNVIVLEKDKKRKSTRKDVDYIQATMLTTQIQKESSALSDSIQNGLAKKNKAFSSRGVKKADFFVLRGVLMPASLVEIGYISNKKETGFLMKAGHQKATADGIADGIAAFIKKYNSIINMN